MERERACAALDETIAGKGEDKGRLPYKMSLRKLPTRSRTLDAEYGYCVLEVAAVAVATVVSDAVEALSRLMERLLWKWLVATCSVLLREPVRMSLPLRVLGLSSTWRYARQ